MPDLIYPTASLDDRITMRGELAALRADPVVQELRLTSREAEREVYELTFEGALPYPLRLIVAGRSTNYSPPNRFSVNRSVWSNPQPQVTIESITSLMREFEGTNNVHDEITLSNVSQDDRANLIRRYVQEMVSSPTRRPTLAAQMAGPLRTRLDYRSIARRVLPIEELPQGPLPVYDRDPEVTRALRFPSVSSWSAFEVEGISVVNPRAILGHRFDVLDSTPVPVPPWCIPGVWIQRGSDQLMIMDTSDPLFILALPLRVRQEVWIPKAEIEPQWAPCLSPPMGKTRFDREFLV